MQTIYRPGQWYLIVIPGALVALPPDATGETVAALWDRLPRERSLATVIDVLTTQAGGSFADMPPFVAAVLEGTDARVAVRGSLAVRVTGADAEAQTFSGADVTTWSERFVPGVSKVEITVDEGGSGSALPVQSGIVLAAAVSADIEPADAEAISVAAGPAPVLDPASAPASVPSVVPAPPAPVAGTSVPLPPPPGVGAVPAVSVPAPDAASDLPTVPPSADDETPDADSDADSEAAAEVADADMIESTLVPGESTFAPPVDEFDHLWGATVHTPIEAAAVRPSEEPETPAVDAGPATGDHDGATISAEELRSLRQSAPAAPEAPTEVIPVAAAAPASTGRIRVSSGQVVALDRTVIIGRRPRSTRASGANLPHLIAVDSPQQDISRSHLEIRPEGDTVVVIDLHTTNGSTLLRPGADPMRLHPGEQTLVLSGDVVDLGDGVTVAFEDLP
ncbi:FHA domain-containing protein [Microbacterium sp. ISL-59]|uniref:FHA domain-containing protein n=1 Tax=Microbacterium sp. ISL-59 TaxID=2819159 RepID=UPI001BE8C6A0|nr:FHA domain-containing protein [Microbacterium sp. ISL-59]MBT2495374.1 FHA domain-containing protein [Microbacterium sp. ISL-59]